MIGQALSIFKQELIKLSTHLSLQKRIHNVHEAVESSDKIPEEFVKQIKEVLEKDIDERVFDYNANVISLYGFWETFVESIIREYIAKLKDFGTCSDNRNSIIVPRFRENVIALFRKVNSSNPKFSHLTEKKLVDSLYVACSQQKNDYLPEAFFQSGGNYNYAEVSDCLKRLGLSNVSEVLQLYPSLVKYFTNQGFTLERIQNTEIAVLFSKLDTLVSMRNEIAHSSISGARIIGADELQEYVEFFEYLACAINEYLSDDLLSITWSANPSVQMEVHHYYDHLDVSELRSKPVRIEVKKPVMYYDSKTYPRFGYQNIKSFFVNDIKFESDIFESLNGDEKITLTFDRKACKGLLVKFNVVI